MIKKLFVIIAIFTAALLAGCASTPESPPPPPYNIISPALPFNGKYKSASVRVYGALDGSVKINEAEEDNISSRLCARLKENTTLKKVEKYDSQAKKKDLNIIIYVQNVQQQQYNVNRSVTFGGVYSGFTRVTVPIGHRYILYMLFMVKLMDAKTSKELGRFECEYTTQPIQGYLDDILSSDEVENLNEKIEMYLKTLL